MPRRSYWRIADSVLWMTCLRLDWRTYKRAVLERWATVTFDAAVSGSIGVSFNMSGYGAGPVTDPASATAASALISSAATGAGIWAGRAAGAARPVAAGARPARACRQAVTPLLASTPSPSGNACARVQGGMAELLVAGVQPAAGGTVLAGIQAGAWFSSRVAR